MLSPTLLLSLFIAILIIVYVVEPLWSARTANAQISDPSLTDLLQRKEMALHAIKELEFDYRTSKLNESDYNRLNQRLRQQATLLLRQIEQLAPENSEMDQAIETAIAGQRRG